MRSRRVMVLLLFFCFVPFLPASPAAETSPRERFTALNALRLDSEHVYKLSAEDRIQLRQGDLLISFERGRLCFFQPFEGRVTGFVFSGLAHTLALPRERVEKQQMARFLGTPVLDQLFVSLYARFSDDSADDLFGQLRRASLKPAPDETFTDRWLPQLERLNAVHSLRILDEKYSTNPRHFFHAGIDGIQTGPFDVLVDHSRAENFLIGQLRIVNKTPFYDVWTSYALPGFTPPRLPFDASHYVIDTTIRSDNSLEGDASIDFRALTTGEGMLAVQLARALKVDNITTASGEKLLFFQNEGLSDQETVARGDDTLFIFLPHTTRTGDNFTLHFHYRGNVIENYGNSVLFVSARESWYPHLGDASKFARYDLTFHWPKHLRLVATGDKSDEHDDGDFRVGTWKSALPVPEAGFNLGEYAFASISSNNHTVDVYANKLLEQAILGRLSPPMIEIAPRFPAAAGPIAPTIVLPPLAPSPADALKSLAREVDTSISFYEKYSGPFPFRHLAVSQIPGTFGQGWPGLLYLSTYAFLPAEAQERAGVNSINQEAFTDIMAVHEVAHQWWGNVVGWSSYRDQWIDEGMAVYLALLFADSQKTPDRTLHTWLDRYRKRLLTKSPESDLAPADVGPVVMGSRLSSSKSMDAYDVVVYSKGAWIYHMLREMLRQPNSRDQDERFVTLLRTLVTNYAQRALSTEDLQREVEAVMTPKMALEGGHSMEWFFEQYVRGTGVPHYRVEFSTRRIEKGFQVRGKLIQSGVPRSFIAPVPIYISTGGARSVLLGTVVTSGEETPFTFRSQIEARKLLIDPRMTLLCVAE
jgi:hypothetical protein